MKRYLALITVLVMTTAAVAMEEEQRLTCQTIRFSNNKLSQDKYINIYNLLPDNDPIFPDTRIEISDLIRLNHLNNRSYKRDESTVTLHARETVMFYPDKHDNLKEYERLGMNNKNNNALIQLYVHAAIRNKLMQLYIGENSKVKFGDSIYFKQNPEDDYVIILEHNNETLTKIPTIELTELIGLPDYKNRLNFINKDDHLLLITYNSQKQ